MNLKLSNLIDSDVASHMQLILGIFLFKLLFIFILFSFFLSFLKLEIVSFVLTVNVPAFSLKQAELQENLEARGERMGGVQTHKRMVASLEKQIAVQEKKLEQVRHVQIFLSNIILPVFEEFI